MPKPASIDCEVVLAGGYGDRASPSGHAGAESVARVGPNAIIQTRIALARSAGPELAQTVFESAGLSRYLSRPPEEMIDECEAATLFGALDALLGAHSAATVLGEAGALTGDYILANRIPRAAQRMLHMLPAAASARILLNAIRAHAWTFAGSGVVTCTYATPMTITIVANPLATPGCPWHLGVFDRLFSSVTGRKIDLRHTACCGTGGDLCRTEIRLT